ncbi:hypothetical protein K7432_012899 [Basidiobolus ranarum]|uniref:Uncharacterized protein n=1 Tax=Basidiobolus ranarum TaxID=34480 RepID=A0ABR2VRL1_9FUNG
MPKVKTNLLRVGSLLLALCQHLSAQMYTATALFDLRGSTFPSTYTYTMGYGTDFEIYEINSQSYTATISGFTVSKTFPSQFFSDSIAPLTFTDDFRGLTVTETFSASTAIRELPARTVIQRVDPTTITRFLPTSSISVDLAALTDTVFASAPFPTVTLTGPDDPNRDTSWELDVNLGTLFFMGTINGPTVTHLIGSSINTAVIPPRTISYVENGSTSVSVFPQETVTNTGVAYFTETFGPTYLPRQSLSLNQALPCYPLL